MDFFEFALAALLIIAITGTVAIKHITGGKRYHRDMVRGIEDEFRARLDRLEAIEKRLEVLEKIVTDRRYDLEQRFRDLEAS